MSLVLKRNLLEESSSNATLGEAGKGRFLLVFALFASSG